MAIATNGFTYVKDFEQLDSYIRKRQKDMEVTAETAPLAKAVTYLLWIGFPRFNIPEILKSDVMEDCVYDSVSFKEREANETIIRYLKEYASMDICTSSTSYLVRTKFSQKVTEEILRSRMRVMNQLSNGKQEHYDMTAIYNCGRWSRALRYEREGGLFPVYRRNHALTPEDLELYNNIFDIEMEDAARVTREMTKYNRWKELMDIDPV